MSSMFRIPLRATVALATTALLTVPAIAQISLGVDTGLLPNAVCVGSTGGTTVFISSTDDCATSSGGLNAGFLQVGPDTSYAYFDATTGESIFTGTVTVQNDAYFNGTTRFTDVVSFSGPNATFATPTFFTFPATFQAATTVNGALTTNGITNTGLITTGNFSSNTIFGNSATITNILGANATLTGSLTMLAGATVDMGGNRIQGVAAGIADTDAVNVAQLVAATSGITADVTALETLTATHTTQIAALEQESLYVSINSDGPAASATGVDAIAIGESSVASADDAIAVGRGSAASGTNAIAIGQGATATGSVAVGAGSSASLGGAAFGDLANATGGNSAAVGTEATATGLSSSAVGYQAVASGIASTALGHNSDATQLGATAVGVSAQATQNFTTSVGRIANASAVGATALGNNAQASAVNSVALGQNSVANQANTVSVGAAGSERRVVNVAAGTFATDAVNLGQLDALGASLSSDIGVLFDLRSSDRRDMKQGVAAAMSMAQAPMPSGPGRVSYAVNGATFRGAYAIGGSLMYRLPTAKPMAVNVGFSYGGGKNNGARVGVAGEF